MAQAGSTVMEQAAYDRLAMADAEGWWFVAKQELAVDGSTALAVRSHVLDVGCGTGGNMGALARHGSGRSSASMSRRSRRSPTGRCARRRCRPGVGRGAPDPVGGAAGIVSMDVIEHLDDDVDGLRAYARALGLRGVVVIVVPAYHGRGPRRTTESGTAAATHYRGCDWHWSAPV